jgi:hypothetical protein
MVKPAPEIAAELTVRGEVPVDVSTRGNDFAVFTVTLPKARLAELTVNCGLAAAAPVPLSATVVVFPPVELLLTVILPLAAPAAVGLNCT